MQKAELVIPCYNEGTRLSLAPLLELRAASLDLLLVDDGSTDDTRERMRELVCSLGEGARTLFLDRNAGKAEAVRVGLRAALERGAEVIGYADADMATPPAELIRLRAELERRGAQGVLGSRVRMLGTDIERRPIRHYLGRVFATVASLALRLPVYDTQCGAKFFRCGPALARAVSRPFQSRWAFDVELLGRLLTGPDALLAAQLIEVPLMKWADAPGSKLSTAQALRTGADLCALAISLRHGQGER